MMISPFLDQKKKKEKLIPNIILESNFQELNEF